MKTLRHIQLAFLSGLLLCLMYAGCKKDNPENPYSGIDYDTDTTTAVVPDPNSITGLHKNIFLPRCATLGCHDATFEPDFRTVQSTYATLVYHPVIKTTVDSVNFFSLRVKPYDLNLSFIHERLTTSTSDYMPSNGDRLSQSEIDHINTWIMNGAKDEAGNVPIAPNLPPLVDYYFVLDSVYRDIDTIRVNGYVSPIRFRQGQTAFFYFHVSDDSTADNALQVNQMKISASKDDFSSAVIYTATYFSGGGYSFWMVVLPTAGFASNTQYFFRYYVNDGFQPVNTEYPRTDYPDYYKENASFIIQ